MGTDNKGDFFDGSLQSNDIGIIINEDGSMFISDKSSSDPVFMSSSHSEINTLRRWIFGERALLSLSKEIYLVTICVIANV